MNPSSADTCPTTSSRRPGARERGQAANDVARWSLAAGAGAVIAAFLASACCIGPVVFALLGLGGAGLLVAFEPYRPFFIAVTLALLGAGFYFAYRRPKATEASDACGCSVPRTRRAGRVALWVTTVLVALFLAFPYVAPLLWG